MSQYSPDWDVLQKAVGQLSPADRLHLLEEVAKSLQPPHATLTPDDRKTNLDALRNAVASMRVGNPDDGFAGRHHDTLLYGGPR